MSTSTEKADNLLLASSATTTHLDTTDWWQAYQSTLLLANFDGDSLQHIFRRLGNARDVAHLGVTCRRLYHYSKVAQKRTRAVRLTHKWSESGQMQEHKAFFRPSANININSSSSSSASSSEQQPAERETPLTVQVRSTFHRTLSPIRTIRSAISVYPNLRHLEVSIPLKSHELDFLLGSLAGSFPLLNNLQLYLFFNVMDFRSWGELWRPLDTLRHPSLRHLTVSLFGRLHITVPENGPTRDMPPLPILRQLTSFTFFADEELSTLLEIIRRLTGSPSSTGAHLTPGEGARFGLRHPFSQNLVAVAPRTRDQEPAHSAPADDMHGKLLSYFTFLEVRFLNWAALNAEQFLVHYFSLISFLDVMKASMLHLQKVSVRLSEAIGKGFTIDYQVTFQALAALPHLTELSIDHSSCPRLNLVTAVTITAETGQTKLHQPPLWPTLPPLPSVRVLSLKHFTHHHNDAVELFQLDHCFPRLRLFNLHLAHSECPANMAGLRPGGPLSVRRAQSCARELLRGLVKLPKEVRFGKMELVFNAKVRFSSLENLQSGTEDKW